ncbi:hypothetical protein CHLRE_16g670617v5 [Chlamydomonas reinhardtii]|uniref:Uncharacterized protein n=1 Tax=Chlamydomonas reinhardtii TaxID=3055 RepID=A8JBE3_CHLRE|nr:uncharacterized protein CHLRE_16g670617v5 [Chlamydomonas reinhardtii]PNW71745.1 hypothetical protein CHLRE_16g670617v5 [Chlamydomonas reinhardtii]|eukprot:XP_001699220.1 predicted protein [Chlamydomonas reinhardtii]
MDKKDKKARVDTDNKDKKDKKHKKARVEGATDVGGAAGEASDPSVETTGRKWTLSVGLPGTLLDAPSSVEFAVATAGQIHRAAANFQVDEVVVYDDSLAATTFQPGQPLSAASVTPGTALLARILQYLDTPPHLRPNMYPEEVLQQHPELRLAASLPVLSPPHHARPSAVWMPYREGVVLKAEAGTGSYVDVGLDRMVYLEHSLQQGARVTVHLGDMEPVTRFFAAYSETMIVGTVVPPSEPRERLGLYWGYTVRIALGLQRVFKDAAVSKTGSYDLTIGSSPAGADTDPGSLVMPRFKHALMVFGGGSPVAAAAAVAEGGAKAKPKAVPGQAVPQQDLDQMVNRVPDWEHKTPQDVFNLYLNTTPHLGTLRIRTEDAIPVALSYLIMPLLKYGKQ